MDIWELPQSELIALPGIGHNVHHLAPDAVAGAVERAAYKVREDVRVKPRNVLLQLKPGVVLIWQSSKILVCQVEHVLGRHRRSNSALDEAVPQSILGKIDGRAGSSSLHVFH